MFVHLAPYDRKFLGPIRRVFERCSPGQHQYLIVGPIPSGATLPGWSPLEDDIAALRDLDDRMDSIEGVLLHGVPFRWAAPIVAAMPRTLGIAWYVWGHEAYEYWPSLSRPTLQPLTADVCRRLNGRKVAVGALARRVLRPHDIRVRRLLNRIDYCVAQIPEEHDLFRSVGLLGPATKPHWGSYGALEDYVDLSAVGPRGDDVQVGNSATATNNHVDAFALLREFDGEERQVVVPLAYGDLRYRDAVIENGLHALGTRFVPVVDFVSLPEFQLMMASCGHVVMNHCRQQAVGNIIAALWRGARVYLNETTVYRGFSKIGLDVSLIQDCVVDSRLQLSAPLSDTELRNRRDVLLSHLSRERVNVETLDLLDKLARRG